MNAAGQLQAKAGASAPPAPEEPARGSTQGGALLINWIALIVLGVLLLLISPILFVILFLLWLIFIF